MRCSSVLWLCLLLWCATVQAADPPHAATTSEPVPQPTSPGETPAQPGPAQPAPAEPAPVQPAPMQPAPMQALPPRPAAAEANPDWAVTLERIAGSVVSIDLDATRAFDTEWNTTAQATGFVVDAERGLILTNRHVVTPGPVTAEATFLDREEEIGRAHV
jgi:S1-C subfamily serine protease